VAVIFSAGEARAGRCASGGSARHVGDRPSWQGGGMWGLFRLAWRQLEPRGGRPDVAGFTPAAELGDEWCRVAVVGDVGHPSPELNATVAALVRASSDRPFDTLALLGDNVYPDGQPALLQRAVLDPFAPLLDTGVAPLAVLGNHDVEAGHGDEIARLLGMPGRWYATTVGHALFVALDSTQPDCPAQEAWLAATLAHARSTWVVVALHHPPYSAGPDSTWSGRRYLALWLRCRTQAALHELPVARAPIGVTDRLVGAVAGADHEPTWKPTPNTTTRRSS
jgi:Calcineurin-like phosphoesterase